MKCDYATRLNVLGMILGYRERGVTAYSTSASSQSYSTFNPNSALSASAELSADTLLGLDTLADPGAVSDSGCDS